MIDRAQSSPLAPHLHPGARITHLDDLELDALAHGVRSPLELWRGELLEGRGQGRGGDSYERMGWCVAVEEGRFEEVRPGEEGTERCCPPLEEEEDHAAPPRVCFTAPSTPSPDPRTLRACLDPLALLPPAPAPAPRCVDGESCAAGHVCARMGARERVLRMRVVGAEDDAAAAEEGRTVLYQGERGAVAQQGPCGASSSFSLSVFWGRG